MNKRAPLIIVKRNVVTDLRYKSYLVMDLCEGLSEAEVLAGFSQWYEQLVRRARAENFPQIQVRFPFQWEGFGDQLAENGFSPGLFVVERRVDQTFLLPDGIHLIDDLMDIKSQLKRQQSLHFHFNPLLFCDPGLFDVDEYLGDLGGGVAAEKGVFYGISARGRIIGFIGLESDENGTYINELFIEEEFRGAGLGKRLMQGGFCYAGWAVNNRIWTTLAAQNDGALRFYLAQGFVETARVDFRNM